MASIKLPFAIRVDDYHDLRNFESLLPKTDRGEKVHVEEIGFDGDYIGIVYATKNFQYENLLKELQAKIDEYESE